MNRFLHILMKRRTNFYFRLGEPEGKAPMNNVVPIFITYKKLGLEIDFKTKSYDDDKNPITSICLLPPMQ